MMTYEEFKEQFHVKLNEQQEEAVQAIDGPCLLLAVPGSGKTTVLINRLGYMIYGRGIAPENILVLTYTVAATKDMAERFYSVFGDEYKDRLEFRTINGISAKIILYFSHLIGRPSFALEADEGQRKRAAHSEEKARAGNKAAEDRIGRRGGGAHIADDHRDRPLERSRGGEKTARSGARASGARRGAPVGQRAGV